MHLSPHERDALLADLVPGDRAEALRAHASTCVQCRDGLRIAEAERAAFLVRQAPAAAARALLDEVHPPSRWRWIVAIPAVGTAALVLFLVLRARPDRDDVRLKGGALACQLVRGDRVIAALPPRAPATAQEGDRVQCTVAPRDDRAHLEVWGADRTGAARLFAADLRGPTALPTAFEIRGHGEMRLYLVWSNLPLPEGALPRLLTSAPADPTFAGTTIDWVATVVP